MQHESLKPVFGCSADVFVDIRFSISEHRDVGSERTGATRVGCLATDCYPVPLFSREQEPNW